MYVAKWSGPHGFSTPFIAYELIPSSSSRRHSFARFPAFPLLIRLIFYRAGNDARRVEKPGPTGTLA
jgi:hypothetical protein